MNAEPSIALPFPAATKLPRSAKTVMRLLERIEAGRLEVELPGERSFSFGSGPLSAHFVVRDWRVFDAVLARGDIGFAESYFDGDWDTPDLAALLTLLNANRETIGQALYGSALALLGARLKHFFNANTRAGSKRNILAHYDLGNDFYRLWLDSSMSYSAALFGENRQRPLREAQDEKNRRILRALGPAPGSEVLEIGCGWGGFAEIAARENALKVHGITLSPAQLAYAQDRMRAAGLAGSTCLELRDYRDLAGQYPAIVSVEMFEAVGERWWPTWFATVARNLAPQGRAMVQSITIDESLFERYRKGTDFIQQFVFPGGMLPSITAFTQQAKKAGLRVTEVFRFGEDYALTLAHWRHSFEAAWPEIARLGFDERFRRLWRFYLAYCEAGFATGSTDVVQFALERER